MILVDTSIWIDYLRSNVSDLADAIDRDLVVTHPFGLAGDLRLWTRDKRLHVVAKAMRLAASRR